MCRPLEDASRKKHKNVAPVGNPVGGKKHERAKCARGGEPAAKKKKKIGKVTQKQRCEKRIALIESQVGVAQRPSELHVAHKRRGVVCFEARIGSVWYTLEGTKDVQCSMCKPSKAEKRDQSREWYEGQVQEAKIMKDESRIEVKNAPWHILRS